MWAFPSLGRDSDFLQWKWDSCVYLAVLQHRCSVAEDEINGAIDFTFSIELPQGVGVKGVLVAFYTDPIECRLV